MVLVANQVHNRGIIRILDDVVGLRPDNTVVGLQGKEKKARNTKIWTAQV